MAEIATDGGKNARSPSVLINLVGVALVTTVGL